MLKRGIPFQAHHCGMLRTASILPKLAERAYGKDVGCSSY